MSRDGRWPKLKQKKSSVSSCNGTIPKDHFLCTKLYTVNMIISAQNYIESRQFSLHKTILYTVKMIISAQNYEQSRRHLCTKLYYIQSRRLSLHKTINHKTIISAQNCTVKMIISAQNYIQSRRLSLHKTIYSQNDYLCTKLYRVKMIISAQNYIESR